jgi:hypothetical protein
VALEWVDFEASGWRNRIDPKLYRIEGIDRCSSRDSNLFPRPEDCIYLNSFAVGGNFRCGGLE